MRKSQMSHPPAHDHPALRDQVVGLVPGDGEREVLRLHEQGLLHRAEDAVGIATDLAAAEAGANRQDELGMPAAQNVKVVSL